MTIKQSKLNNNYRKVYLLKSCSNCFHAVALFHAVYGVKLATKESYQIPGGTKYINLCCSLIGVKNNKICKVSENNICDKYKEIKEY